MIKRTAANDSYGGDVMSKSCYGSDNTGYFDIQNCIPNCTAYAQGRANETGTTSSFGGGQKYEGPFSVSRVRIGDILGGNGHGGFVEDIVGSTIYVSGSAYTTENGGAHNGSDVGGKTERSGNTSGATCPLSDYSKTINGIKSGAKHYDKDYGGPGGTGRFGSGGGATRIFRYGKLGYASGNSWSDSGGGITTIYYNPNTPGGVPGGDDSQEEGETGGDDDHGTTILVPVEYEVDFTGNMYECGTGTFGNQSGTQDAPMAPSEISQSTERENQRGEPFNMYTYERTLTYDKNNNSVGSGGEQKYSGSQTVMLGEQPSYGNGGEMEGQGDDD